MIRTDKEIAENILSWQDIPKRKITPEESPLIVYRTCERCNNHQLEIVSIEKEIRRDIPGFITQHKIYCPICHEFEISLSMSMLFSGKIEGHFEKGRWIEDMVKGPDNDFLDQFPRAAEIVCKEHNEYLRRQAAFKKWVFE